MHMPTLLITGASGLLGRALTTEFKRVGAYTVRGTALRRVADGLDPLDLCDTGALTRYLTAVHPDIIIHSAAERHPDVSQRDPAATHRLNIDATGWIAEHAAATGALMVYVSTDYVFDGTNPPYGVNDTPHPLNFYGESKLAGEAALRATAAHASILRVPILYGPVEYLSESPVTLIAETLLEHAGGPIELDDWSIRHPTLTTDVAVTCRQLVGHLRSGAGPIPVCHWSGTEAMTRYTMGLAMADILGVSSEHLVPVQTNLGAPRPKNSKLDCRLLESLVLGSRTPFRTAIAGVLAECTKRSSPR